MQEVQEIRKTLEKGNLTGEQRDTLENKLI